MTDTGAMTLGKNLKGRGEAKAEGYELIQQSVRKKQEVTTTAGMDRNPSVSILEGEGEHPDMPLQRKEDRLGGPHLEPCRVNEAVEERQVNHRPQAHSRPHYKQMSIIAWRGEASSNVPLEIKDRTSSGKNTKEGVEPLTEEEVTTTGHGTPTSTPPPPKVPPPCPTRWASGGTDSRVP